MNVLDTIRQAEQDAAELKRAGIQQTREECDSELEAAKSKAAAEIADARAKAAAALAKAGDDADSRIKDYLASEARTDSAKSDEAQKNLPRAVDYILSGIRSF